jgi:hypothetical protein
MRSRREFLADVGRGMLVAGVGYSTALDLGLSTASAAEGAEANALTFGSLEPLVGLMQDTPVNKLLSTLVEKIHSGTELRQLVAAAALANARTFGGEDYVGFHTMMAMMPAYQMSQELPTEKQALPVLKVLYRNTNRIHEFGGRSKEVLHPVSPADLPAVSSRGDVVRQAVHSKDVNVAERTFAAVATSPEEAFNAVLYAVQDNTEVHRVVLPYRAYVLLDLLGPEQALTMLRQSVRYCVRSERRDNRSAEFDRPRTLLPKVFDQHKLTGRTPGTRVPDDAWVDAFSQTLFKSTPDQAADAAGAALAEGIAPDAICEAVSLAANQLVLRDSGRREGEIQPGKPLGSVHGDSIGVHASDSANAWRNMVKFSNARNQFACTILAAFQVAYDRVNRGGDFLNWQPRPHAEHLEKVTTRDPNTLLKQAEEAIRANDQARAAALVHLCGELRQSPRPVLDLLLRFAITEDGALHAEKYYRTASEEFANMRQPFRWRQLTALARVTASCYGSPAAGCDEAMELLKV